jgi:regulator of protease activity HflC (stomatin/prohibitin superfamily)
MKQGSVGLVSRFGQFYKSVDPGLVQVNVCTESLRIVDVKIQISPIGKQSVITRDNVNVEMYATPSQSHNAHTKLNSPRSPATLLSTSKS